MKDPNVEIIVRIPRLRVIDCKRLIFRLGQNNPEWRDIDSDPDIYPIYLLPKLKRSKYKFGETWIEIGNYKTINDLSRKFCEILRGESQGNEFLHTIIFMKNGEIQLKYEKI